MNNDRNGPPDDDAIVTVTSGMQPYVVRLQRPFRPAAEPD